ncbi:MauE/DoxX family redox-associated membrane protein [Longitalea luteola]|uniref:MauE/DoxX family redox-associated membrane protein n=1 Tax=Longitalea luteola TaxID=2812563 RepID=UPI0034E205C8
MRHSAYPRVANAKRNGIRNYLLEKKIIIVEIVSGLLILLFLYTGLSKLFDHDVFAFQLGRSPLLQSAAPILSYALPIIELITAILLFTKQYQAKALNFSFILLSSFTVYLIFMVAFYKDLPCTCGGVISKMSWQQHIVFNLIITFLTFLAIRLNRKMNIA